MPTYPPATGTARDVHAALRATADTLTAPVTAADLALVTRDYHGDNDTGNLLEHLPWAVTEVARRTAAETPLAVVDAADLFTTAATGMLARGPVEVGQLPDTVTGERIGALHAGVPAKQVLLEEWRARVEAILAARWQVWAPAVAHRLDPALSPVWLAMLTPRPDLFAAHAGAGFETVTVPGAPDSAIAALVHPAAAELELDDDNGRGRVLLLPGAGVTGKQIEVALQLREQARAGDPTAPLTSLGHALAAAAAVLGTAGASAAPAVEVPAALRALLPQPPAPPIRVPRCTVWPGGDHRFALAA